MYHGGLSPEYSAGNNHGKISEFSVGTHGSKFERIALNELRQGRRGKHNKLIMGIFDEMSTLADGEALKVPTDCSPERYFDSEDTCRTGEVRGFA